MDMPALKHDSRKSAVPGLGGALGQSLFHPRDPYPTVILGSASWNAARKTLERLSGVPLLVPAPSPPAPANQALYHFLPAPYIRWLIDSEKHGRPPAGPTLAECVPHHFSRR